MQNFYANEKSEDVILIVTSDEIWIYYYGVITQQPRKIMGLWRQRTTKSMSKIEICWQKIDDGIFL